MTSLIVDDESAARSRLTRLLGAHPNIEVIGQASDGLQALHAIETLCPDLVFLDIQIPGVNGFEVRLDPGRRSQTLGRFRDGLRSKRAGSIRRKCKYL